MFLLILFKYITVYNICQVSNNYIRFFISFENLGCRALIDTILLIHNIYKQSQSDTKNLPPSPQFSNSSQFINLCIFCLFCQNPLVMRKNAVFYRNRIITLIFPFTEIIIKAYTTLVSTIIYHKFT